MLHRTCIHYIYIYSNISLPIFGEFEGNCNLSHHYIQIWPPITQICLALYLPQYNWIPFTSNIGTPKVAPRESPLKPTGGKPCLHPFVTCIISLKPGKLKAVHFFINCIKRGRLRTSGLCSRGCRWEFRHCPAVVGDSDLYLMYWTYLRGLAPHPAPVPTFPTLSRGLTALHNRYIG